MKNGDPLWAKMDVIVLLSFFTLPTFTSNYLPDSHPTTPHLDEHIPLPYLQSLRRHPPRRPRRRLRWHAPAPETLEGLRVRFGVKFPEVAIAVEVKGSQSVGRIEVRVRIRPLLGPLHEE